MPNIGKNIMFTGDAKNTLNIENAYINPDKIFCEWNFQELALDTTNQYTAYLDTSSTAASGQYGALLTTAAANAKTCSLACGGIWWYPAKNCIIEAKFSIDVVTNVCINVGFNDAVSEASNTLPFAISGATITDTATNAAMFCFDTNQDTDYWYVVQTKAGTQTGTLLAAKYAPGAGVSVRLRVAIDVLGNARYYYNGTQVGYKALATATATPLVPYVGIKNNTATAHVLTLRYVRAWQDI